FILSQDQARHTINLPSTIQLLRYFSVHISYITSGKRCQQQVLQQQVLHCFAPKSSNSALASFTSWVKSA
ncbi:MAG: hypothetical protein WC749_08840, partial [Dehalococcoidia bacterium]